MLNDVYAYFEANDIDPVCYVTAAPRMVEMDCTVDAGEREDKHDDFTVELRDCNTDECIASVKLYAFNPKLFGTPSEMAVYMDDTDEALGILGGIYYYEKRDALPEFLSYADWQVYSKQRKALGIKVQRNKPFVVINEIEVAEEYSDKDIEVLLLQNLFTVLGNSHFAELQGITHAIGLAYADYTTLAKVAGIRFVSVTDGGEMIESFMLTNPNAAHK